MTDFVVQKWCSWMNEWLFLSFVLQEKFHDPLNQAFFPDAKIIMQFIEPMLYFVTKIIFLIHWFQMTIFLWHKNNCQDSMKKCFFFVIQGINDFLLWSKDWKIMTKLIRLLVFDTISFLHLTSLQLALANSCYQMLTSDQNYVEGLPRNNDLVLNIWSTIGLLLSYNYRAAAVALSWLTLWHPLRLQIGIQQILSFQLMHVTINDPTNTAGSFQGR